MKIILIEKIMKIWNKIINPIVIFGKKIKSFDNL